MLSQGRVKTLAQYTHRGQLLTHNAARYTVAAIFRRIGAIVTVRTLKELFLLTAPAVQLRTAGTGMALGGIFDQSEAADTPDLLGDTSVSTDIC